MEALHVGVEARGGVVPHARSVPVVTAFIGGCTVELWTVCRPEEMRGVAAVTGMRCWSQRRWRMSPQPKTRKTADVAGKSGVCRWRRRSMTCVTEEEVGGCVKSGGGP